jgi:23S rRNA (adenine2503-C2)-methyltransferase
VLPCYQVLHGRRRNQHYLPQALREALPDIEAELAGLTRLHSVHPGEDGSERLLLTLADGQTGGKCAAAARRAVHQQPGGLRGGLPLLHDRARRPAAPAQQRRDGGPGGAGAQRAAGASKVVFMGMGEPAHNLDAVLEAIQLLGTRAASATSSWCSPPWATRAPSSADGPDPGEGVCKPALALSLHTTAARAARAPAAARPAHDAGRAGGPADAYARATGYPVQYQWTLLDGVNDGRRRDRRHRRPAGGPATACST